MGRVDDSIQIIVIKHLYKSLHSKRGQLLSDKLLCKIVSGQEDKQDEVKA